MSDLHSRSANFRSDADRIAALKARNAELEQYIQQCEAALRQADTQLCEWRQRFADAMPVCVAYIDKDQRYQFVNKAYEGWFDCHRAEVAGKSLQEVVGEEVYQTIQHHVHQALAGQFTSFEATIPCSYGQDRYVATRLLPDADEQGSVNGFYGFTFDLTHRKQTEEALRRSEEKLRLTLDLTHIGCWDWQIATNEVEWNDNHSRLLGLVPGEVPYSYQAWRDRVHPDDIDRVEAAVNQALATHTDFEAEYRVVHPDGRVHWLIGRGRGIYTESGEAVRMVGVIFDISDRKQAEAETRRSLSLLQTTLESTADGILSIDAAGNIINFNRRFVELWQIPESLIWLRDDWQLIPFLAAQLENSEDFLQQIQSEYNRPDLESHTSFRLKDGRVFERYSKPQVLTGTIVGRVVSYRDISNLKRVEAALRESESYYRAIVEDQTELICRFGKDGKITFVNQAYCRYFGRQLHQLLGQPFIACISATEQTFITEQLTDLSDLPVDQPYCYEYQSVLPNGERRWQQWTNRAIVNELGQIIGYQAVGRDITDRKLIEAALQRLNQELEFRVQQRTYELEQSQLILQQREAALKRQLVAIEAATVGIAILDESNHYIYLNAAHLRIFGYADPAELIGQTWQTLYCPDEIQFFEQTVFPFLPQNGYWQGETIGKRKDGSTFVEEVSLTLVDQVGLICVCQDISDRKQAEAQLRASLEEKNILLQEIHHRVKNNLQTVSSLLRLQAQSIQSPEVLEPFKESQNRVKAMALIHEKLYQSSNLAKVNFADYVGVLTEELLYSYAVNTERIQLQIDATDVELSLDTANPCGLIVNELVSNALKYAFPGDRSGTIRICFVADASRHYTLTVSDDGVGLPEGLDWRTVRSLGLRLVQSLVRQIQGEIERVGDRGCTFKVTWKD
jgi:PAS domain S-box-containing protein